jgi:hypothetical protein
MRVVDGVEAGIMKSTVPLASDTILSGHAFLQGFELDFDRVPSAAVMVRKTCYEQISLYPPDLPYCGDWYLWCLFALYHDVGYFAEPMVSRRFHGRNMSHFFCNEGIQTYFNNLLTVPTRIREIAEREKHDAVIKSCNLALASGYLRLVTPPLPDDWVKSNMTEKEFEASLPRYACDAESQAEIRTHVYAGLGDHYYERGDAMRALAFYRRALREDRPMSKVWIKYLLLRMGSGGRFLREALSLLKQRLRRSGLAKV